MLEYVSVFIILLVASLAFFLVYRRYLVKPRQEESSLYVQSLLDLLAGEKVKAFAKLRQVVTEDSSNIDAYLRLGQVLREYGKPDRALQVHKDLTLRTNLSATEKAAILKQLAEDYFALNDMDMAEAAVKELISNASQDRWAHKTLLTIQEKTNKLDEAYDTAAQLLKIEGNKSKKLLAVYKYRQGDDLYKKREYHKARILFKEAIGLDPAYVPAYLAIGDSYCDEDRQEDAVNYWKKLILAVPDQGHQVIGRLKKTLFALGRYGELSEICESILHHDSKNLEARLTLAEFSKKKGDIELARTILEQIMDDTPDNLKVIIELIRIYLDQGDRKKIEDFFRTLERRSEQMQQQNTANRLTDASLMSTH